MTRAFFLLRGERVFLQKTMGHQLLTQIDGLWGGQTSDAATSSSGLN